MLVLTRKCGEIVVSRNRSTGEELQVMVCRVGPDFVRLGFTAESVWDIARQELLGRHPEEHGGSQQ